MYIKFWGVRGSLPTPLTPEQIKSKISAVVQRITAEDIASIDSRERFLSTLPEWIYGTVGGNTACVEIRNNNSTFILDAGTGIRLLGKRKLTNEKNVFHIFFSHFHWDHIQGLPFFDPLYNPNIEIHIYSPDPDCRHYLEEQMESPFYPVSLKKMNPVNIIYHQIPIETCFEIDGTTIQCKKMSHPGGSYSYSFESNGKKVIYATDVELVQYDLLKESGNGNFFNDSDVLILDAQYTVEEAYAKENWGHTAFSHAIDFAVMWKTKKLFLFHHEPMYNDKKIASIMQTAGWYSEYIGQKDIEIYPAIEDSELEI